MAIERNDPSWRAFFHDAWRTLLSRQPQGEQILLGPKIASEAAALADDAMREVLGLASPLRCEHCAGVGCARCVWSGADAKRGLASSPFLREVKPTGETLQLTDLESKE